MVVIAPDYKRLQKDYSAISPAPESYRENRLSVFHDSMFNNTHRNYDGKPGS